METFFCKTGICSGSGAVSALKDMKSKRLFMVADPYFMNCGQAQRIAGFAGAEAVEYFSDISPDPAVELAAAGTAKLRQFQPDTVVALGGGSTIDCAKAMVYFAEGPVRLVAIPTTSGSGSEVTDFAILTHGDTKYPLIDRKICPDMAILDSDLLKDLPPSIIADAGFDILTHAVEAFVATDAGCISDALAASAFSAAFSSLGASYGGDSSVRLKIHKAATMAGMAFSQAGLGLCHAMAHALGGLFHVPHGRLGAILLPAVIRCNAHKCAEKYARLSRAAGLGGSADTVAVRNLQTGLCRLRTELNMPATLTQAGVDPRQVWHLTDSIVKTALEDPCCKKNPLLVEDFMVRRVLSEVTGRG